MPRRPRSALLAVLAAVVGCNVYDASLLSGGAGGPGVGPQASGGRGTAGGSSGGKGGATGGVSGGGATGGVAATGGSTGGTGGTAAGAGGTTGGGPNGGDGASGGTGGTDPAGGAGNEGGEGGEGTGGSLGGSSNGGSSSGSGGTGGASAGTGGTAGTGGSSAGTGGAGGSAGSAAGSGGAGGTAGTGGTSGTGGTGGSAPATGCAVLTTALDDAADKAHFLITLPADTDFSAATVSLRVYASGALGGTLFMYVQQATYEFWGESQQPLTAFTGWKTIDWNVGAEATTGIDKTKIRRLGIEINGTGSSSWSNPTTVYIDSITVTAASLSFPLTTTGTVYATATSSYSTDTAMWLNSATDDTSALTGTSIAWAATCP